MADEVWKSLDWIESELEYLVSSEGRIKRVPTAISVRNGLTGRENVRILPERILRKQLNCHGYEIIPLHLARGRHPKTFAIAPLVCRAFHGERSSPELHCAHLDGNPLNNRAENLAWVTREENEAHKALHGTKMYGSRHPQAKLTEPLVREIKRRLKNGERGIDIAPDYNVSHHMISKINCGHNWAHVKAA